MNKKIWILVIAIILLGSLLRFYSLEEESFWMDEGASALTVKKYSAWQIINNVREEGQILPGYYYYDDDLPGYYVILKGWVNVFGISDFSVRAFSALLGSLSLIAIFYFTRYLFDEKIALLATFLASINLTLIWYSQEARQYSYLLFLSLLSVIFLVKYFKEEKTKYAVGLIIVNTFIIFTHFPWLMFITFQGVYALYIMYKDFIHKKKFHTKIIVAFLIIGVLYLTIIGRALFSQTDTIELYGKPSIGQIAEFGVRLSTWLYPSEAMRQKIYEFSLNFSLFEWALLISVLLSASLIGLLFLIGIVKSFYKKKSAVFILLMFFFPLLFAITLSLIHPKFTVFQIKQVIYIIPAYLIFASIGCLRTKLSKTLIAIIIILSVLPTYAYYTNFDKQQFREAADFLPKDEPIFLNMDTAQVVFKYYYGEKDNVIGVKDVTELKSFLGDTEKFWMILTFTKYSDPDNQIKKFLDDNYSLIGQKEFFDIELLHYGKI